MGESLNPVDSSFLQVETPTRKQVIGVYCHLRGIPNREALEFRLRETTERYPRMKCKRVDMHWEHDPSFDLNNHLIWIELPTETTQAELDGHVEKLLFPEFPPNISPWQIIILHRRQDNSADAKSTADLLNGLIYKAHHSWTDGVGGMEVLHDLCRNHNDGARSRTPRRNPLQDDSSYTLNLGKFLTTARSILYELLAPVADLGFPPAQSIERRISFASFPYAEFQIMKRGTRAHFNAIFLGIMTAGLAKYRETKIGILRPTKKPRRVRALIPLNLRKVHEHYHLGNRLTAANIELPIATTLTPEMVSEISTRLLATSQRTLFAVYSTLALLSTYLPVRIRKYCLRKLSFRSHFICTYVRSPFADQHIAGAEILSYYAYPALMPGHSFGAAFSTYSKSVFMSVDTDPLAIPDPERLIACMLEAKNELLNSFTEQSLQEKLEP